MLITDLISLKWPVLGMYWYWLFLILEIWTSILTLSTNLRNSITSLFLAYRVFLWKYFCNQVFWSIFYQIFHLFNCSCWAIRWNRATNSRYHLAVLLTGRIRAQHCFARMYIRWNFFDLIFRAASQMVTECQLKRRCPLFWLYFWNIIILWN